jgi:hypothetical protein
MKIAGKRIWIWMSVWFASMFLFRGDPSVRAQEQVKPQDASTVPPNEHKIPRHKQSRFKTESDAWDAKSKAGPGNAWVPGVGKISQAAGEKSNTPPTGPITVNKAKLNSPNEQATISEKRNTGMQHKTPKPPKPAQHATTK